MTFVKHDRVARLARLAALLHRYPHGLTASMIAEHLGVNVRTVYRDLRVLEDEIGVPVWQNGLRYGAEVDAFLPPLALSLPEAVAVFLAVRLVARTEDVGNRFVLTALGKLASILPGPIARHVDSAIAAGRRPTPLIPPRAFEAVSLAWADSRKLRFKYPYTHTDGRVSVHERTVSPYFIEPNPVGRTNYLVGFDEYARAVRTFRIERIEAPVLTNERFEIPADFDAVALLTNSWSISDEPLVDVHVRFRDRATGRRASESVWHRSQRVIDSEGGTEIIFRIAGTREILPWILSWGTTIEVISPASLRETIRTIGLRLAETNS